MQRVNSATLPLLLKNGAKTVLMFGAPSGEATMMQAEAFAEAWADHHDLAHFAYIDAFDEVALARHFGVHVMPTTIVLAGDRTLARFEGRCPPMLIGAALASRGEMRTAA